MKKILLLLSCMALLAACGRNSGTEHDNYYSADSDKNRTAANEAITHNQSESNTDVDPGGGAVAANYARGQSLIASSDCMGCHQEKQKLVGPAYVEVAKKYEFNEENVTHLAHAIIKGGKGVWGEIPMSPHPDLKEEDAKEMARYVLTLNK